MLPRANNYNPMKPMGSFLEAEWDLYCRIFSMDEPDFEEVHDQCSFPLEHHDLFQSSSPADLCSKPETNVSTIAANDCLLHSENTVNPCHHNICQENFGVNNDYSIELTNTTSYHNFQFSSDFISGDISMSMDFSIMDEGSTGLLSQLFAGIPMEEIPSICHHQTGSEKMENSYLTWAAACAAPATEVQLKFQSLETETNSRSHATKRRCLASDVQKKNKNTKTKKSRKFNLTPIGNDEEETNAGIDAKSLSSYSSEDDNASQDSNEGASCDSKASEAIILTGKKRTSRGSATVPQSLYARKRRERINERLRILQNLVPNGTKVDISTMLEEAVHYVKFLQLQIKLLSSDDLWMFAPIAYNGIDVDLGKISMH